MKVKIKKLHPGAVIPKYAKSGDAGMDLTAISKEIDEYGNIVYHTGLAFEIPKGYVGLVFPRSSICKKDIYLTNAVGVIDSGYRGEVTAKFKSGIRLINPLKLLWGIITRKTQMKFTPVYNMWGEKYSVGDRIAQIIILPYPQIEFEETEELSTTDRGMNGYGSTGK